MKVYVQRVMSSELGTYGVLLYGKFPICVTLELPWFDNRKCVSCIPSGQYRCRKVESPKFGPTFEILNVPNRSEILFHIGNYLQDTDGCILLGMTFSPTTNDYSIQQSRKAFEKFMYYLGGFSGFELDILDGVSIRADNVTTSKDA